jgi:MoxR-like ATPase
LAAIRGRDYVIPDDIHYLLPAILPHRLIVAPEAELRGFTSKGVLQSIVEKIPLPISSQTQ